MKFSLPFILFWAFSSVLSQNGTTLFFHIDKITIKQKTINDSTFAKRYKEKAETEFNLQGYTGVAIKDSIIKGHTTHYYYSYTNHFDKISLTCESDSSKKSRTENFHDYISTLQMINKNLTELENNGFPFAEIKITKQNEDKNKLQLTYKIDSGLFYKIEKITLKSKEKFHEPTILNIVNIQTGDTYNESKIVSVSELLSASGLYHLIRPAEVVFRQGKAELFLIIEKDNSSDADGFVGFQQDKITQKLALNGYINLSLHNAFNRSESFVMNWKNNPNQTQNLFIRFEYPYILKTAIGVGTRLNLQKQDSSFVRADSYFDLNYLQPYYKFGVYYQLESSATLLSTLPSDLRDYKKNTFGLSLRYNPMLAIPFQFFHPVFSANGGFFNYRADSVDVNSKNGSNTKYNLKYEHVVDFLKYFHLHNAIRYEGLTASNQLARNELVFFGGLRSIRGFYELELSGNDVIILNNEIEFAPVNSLSFKLLYDYASYQNSGWKYAQALGFGFTFTSGSVKLELILATGWENSNTPNLNNSKVHLGFKSSF